MPEKMGIQEGEIEEITFPSPPNILSVDVECWEQNMCFNLSGQWIPPSYEKTVDNTQYLLEIFREKRVRATFFVLGTIAEAFPDLIRQINEEGHEVATHGYHHINLSNLTREQFRHDLTRSIDLLTGIVNKPILGFRAPCFSIVNTSMWALDILLELGLKYDSSIFPIASSRYGIADFPRGPVRVKRGSQSIIEFPLSTIRWRGENWPVAGGGYFRLLPFSLIRRFVRGINEEGLPFVTYCHPYEFDSKALRFSRKPEPFSWFAGRKRELRTNMFRRTVRRKQIGLLDEFKFVSFREILNGQF